MFVSYFLGRNQVAAGLMPIDFENKSSQSTLSVYPLAIANCQETRLCGHHYNYDKTYLLIIF